MEWFMSEQRRIGRGLLIFDLDGTLADTIEGIQNGVNMALQQYGFPLRGKEEVRAAIGNGAYRLIERCMPAEAAEDATLVQRVYADYDVFYGKIFCECHLYDGVLENLMTLRDRGYTLAVLSNKPDVYVRATIAALLPDGLFSYTAGQTELPKKPDPTVPLMIAKTLGFSSQCSAFVGDSEVDVQTALNAEMFAVGCSWGYRDRDSLIRAGVHAVADSPAEWLELFE